MCAPALWGGERMAPDTQNERVTLRDDLERLAELARHASLPEDRNRLESTIQLILWTRQLVSKSREREQQAWLRTLTAAARVERLVLETSHQNDELQIIRDRTPK